MAKQFTFQLQLPMDNYIIRCTGASFGPSKASGKPMITLEHEIVSPETVEINGEQYTVAGVKTKPSYHVTQSIDENGNLDPEKTENLKARLDELFAFYGLPPIDNPENPNVEGFVGKQVWALLSTDKFEKRRSPTSEQLARGEKQGDIIRNPVTGEPLVSFFPKVDQFFGQPAQTAVA